MFRDVKAAGLKPCEIARLLNVSRVTVSLWMSGRNKPHNLIAVRVSKLLDSVRLCVENASFPVPRDISRRERGLYIRTALEAVGWKDHSDN
jgi:transcriptional regulator with XRE-family HTH domain